MAVYKRGETWWYSFLFAGRRIQESAKTASKTLAKRAEAQRRRELEESFNAVVDKRSDRVRTVAEAIESYIAGYGADHESTSLDWVKATLREPKAILGNLLVSDLTEDRMRRFVETRKAAGMTNRRVNMELGNLSRAIGRKRSEAWPNLRKLRENTDIGRALSPEEETKLRAALAECESDAARAAVYVALNTGMRSDEIKKLRWSNVDLAAGALIVGVSKTEGGRGRYIPLNAELRAVLEAYRDWYAGRFERADPNWFLFPAGQRGRTQGRGRKEDPTRPIGSIKTAWGTIRERSGVQCRFHDLRHTVATKMAEAGVPESTMLAIMGQMSRAMLERYSHIRMQAKRDAVEALQMTRTSQATSTKSTTMDLGSTVQ